MNDIKIKILDKLNFGLNVTYKTSGIERSLFNSIVKELAEDGYVKFTPETNEMFKDDVNKVRITSKGKEFIENYKK